MKTVLAIVVVAIVFLIAAMLTEISTGLALSLSEWPGSWQPTLAAALAGFIGGGAAIIAADAVVKNYNPKIVAAVFIGFSILNGVLNLTLANQPEYFASNSAQVARGLTSSLVVFWCLWLGKGLTGSIKRRARTAEARKET